MISRLLFPLFLGAAVPCWADPIGQKPLLPTADGGDASIQTKLHGRFLHITDLHADPFYSQYSSPDDDNACHWGKGDAGIFGAEKTDCDSPISLVNATFQWINDNLKDSIDFVVWTGDSARHDNDELIPRSEKQVIYLNELLVNKFVEVFGKEDNINDTDPTNDFTIPIIPNFGNNDILPHNIFSKGPNRWTKTFTDVWRRFIPEEQRHGFERGGWFFVEVIPNQLAVFSLNTLYFFNNNAAVNGCAQKSEPGFEHFEWLRIQLRFIRERGMKAILSGHVPPARTESKQSWDETCWQKYTYYLQQYRDVIIGGLYGHMNIDHFMLQDSRQVDMKVISGEVEPTKKPRRSHRISTQSSADYLTELRYGWSNLPDKVEMEYMAAHQDVRPSLEASRNKKSRKSKHGNSLDEIGGYWGERYSATFVGASVVPNYFPAMRVYEYNTTGMGHTSSSTPSPDHEMISAGLEESKHKKHKEKGPEPPSKSQPPGPAYSPQTLSLLSYTQYFANLSRINAASASSHDSSKAKFSYEVEYDTKEDSVYKLPDLTMRSYIDLAARIGKYAPDEDDLVSERMGEVEDEASLANKKKKHKKKKGHGKRKAANKLWLTFVNRAYVGAKDEEDLHDQFGFAIDD
ncbi:MAG: hypothetical protein Q9183_001512 [Haloplaca sp. 2 TL-2023]